MQHSQLLFGNSHFEYLSTQKQQQQQKYSWCHTATSTWFHPEIINLFECIDWKNSKLAI